MGWLIPKYELENFKGAQNTLTWMACRKIALNCYQENQNTTAFSYANENVVSGLQRA